jgi:Fanconi anemia group M protein
LTASPGGYEAKIVDVCRNLGIEAIEYRTEEDHDVKAYIQPINLDWRRLPLPAAYLQVRDNFNELLMNLVKSLQSFGVLSGKGSTFVTRRDLVELNQEIQHRLENGEGGYLYNLKVRTTAALSVMHMIVLIETQGPETLSPFIQKTLTRMAAEGSRGHKLIINSPLFQQAKQTLLRCLTLENPKVTELVKVLRQQYTKKQTSRILVFTQYRDTVLALLNVLRKKLDLTVSRFVGQGFREGDPGMTQKQQRAALENLRNGAIHVLIATSIAEEGLDIPEVDHVVFYEPVPSEIRYIQRRGRTGRQIAGKVTILIAEKTLDEAFYWSSLRKTKKMKKTIKQLNTRLPQMLKKPVRLTARQRQKKLASYLVSERDTSVNESTEDTKVELWKPEIIKGAGITQILTWLIANLPEEPTTINLLVETAVKETSVEKGVVEAAIWRLIQQGYLYQRSPGEIIKL